MGKRVGLAIILLLCSCTTIPSVSFDGVSFSVEIADSQKEHAQGLMHRESMDDNTGMLFVFDETKPRTFWMKNTLIPLDMVFLDGDFVVVDIITAVPCKKDPCEKYPSEEPAKFVLEINAGLAEKYEIKKGSLMTLSE